MSLHGRVRRKICMNEHQQKCQSRGFFFIYLITLSALLVLKGNSLYAGDDLQQSVLGDGLTPDALSALETKGKSPYVLGSDEDNPIEKLPVKSDYLFNPDEADFNKKSSPKAEFEDVGQTLPGTFEKNENYIELDKAKMVRGFRKYVNYSLNLIFIKNDYDYTSQNNIIEETIKDHKGGAIHLSYNEFLSKASFLNSFWTLGVGLGHSQGSGVFAKTRSKSNTVMRLWEFPLTLGLGFEFPFTNVFKWQASAGPGVLVLSQNRSDKLKGEKGKNKYQFGQGFYADSKLQFNLSGHSDEEAYNLYITSQITNLYLDLVARYQYFGNFKDDITITGVSFGLGFTFEYL